jgi:hypothetical protein
MEAARTSETSVDIRLITQQYIPEDSELHTRRRESLKAHIDNNTRWNENKNSNSNNSIVMYFNNARWQICIA